MFLKIFVTHILQKFVTLSLIIFSQDFLWWPNYYMKFSYNRTEYFHYKFLTTVLIQITDIVLQSYSMFGQLTASPASHQHYFCFIQCYSTLLKYPSFNFFLLYLKR